MITDARALQPEYVPSEIYHREGEINVLTSALRPLTDGVSGSDVFIFGPSGTGKTTLARHVVDLLQQQTLDTTVGYVNAMSNSTHADALYELTRDASIANDLRKTGTPASAFLHRIEDVEGQFVAIIDEVHVLEEYRTLQALWEVPELTLVMICLEEDRLFAEFDNQLRSRLGMARSVHLDRYSVDEMATILRGRVKAGLQPGVIDENTLRYIADLAAGDARRGIALLRESVEEAMAEDYERVTREVVDEAKTAARDAVRQSRVRRLDTDKRLLYEIVREAGRIDGGTLHSRYENRSQDPVAKSTRRKYLARLEEYELLETRGEGRGKEYVFPDAA